MEQALSFPSGEGTGGGGITEASRFALQFKVCFVTKKLFAACASSA